MNSIEYSVIENHDAIVKGSNMPKAAHYFTSIIFVLLCLCVVHAQERADENSTLQEKPNSSQASTVIIDIIPLKPIGRDLSDVQYVDRSQTNNSSPIERSQRDASPKLGCDQVVKKKLSGSPPIKPVSIYKGTKLPPSPLRYSSTSNNIDNRS